MAVTGFSTGDDGAIPFEVGTAGVDNQRVIQTALGLAGIAAGADDLVSGQSVAVQYRGSVTVDKTTGQVFLPGVGIDWLVSTNKAVLAGLGDFYLGLASEHAASAATKASVELNLKPGGVSLRSGSYLEQAILGLGVTVKSGGTVRLELDGTSEAATASILSDGSVPVGSGFIWDALISIDDNGTSVLDIVLGVANDDNATDADSITEFCGFSINGGDLAINAESDDGTTEVAATDTTLEYVVGTPKHYMVDARDPSDCQLYVDGVLVLAGTTFTLAAATGPMKALVMMEKTVSTETGIVEIHEMNLRRTGPLAAVTS